MTKSILLALSASTLLFTVACGDDDTADTTGTTTSTSVTTGGEGGTTTSGMGGSTTSGMGGSGGAAAAMGAVRVAHLSPDAPAVDFCVSPDGGQTWVGPVAENILKAADGLAYSGVTGYIPLPAATYDIRLVAPTATDCDTELVPTFKGITLPADVDATIAATGFLTPGANQPAFDLTVYVDNNAAPAAGKAHLRFIHASPDTPSVDVGVGKGQSFTAVFSGVEFPKVGTPEYFETDPLSKVTLSARATGTDTDAIVLEAVDLPAGAIATAFAIGNLAGSPQPLKVLVCVDNAAMATCSVLP